MSHITQMTFIHQGPIPLIIFHRNSHLIGMLFYRNLIDSYFITSKFCSCHGSTSLVSWAKIFRGIQNYNLGEGRMKFSSHFDYSWKSVSETVEASYCCDKSRSWCMRCDVHHMGPQWRIRYCCHGNTVRNLLIALMRAKLYLATIPRLPMNLVWYKWTDFTHTLFHSTCSYKTIHSKVYSAKWRPAVKVFDVWSPNHHHISFTPQQNGWGIGCIITKSAHV